MKKYNIALWGIVALLCTTTMALGQASNSSITGQRISCVDGIAADFSCSSVDILSVLVNVDIGPGTALNDIWGWTDPETGKEYALVGRTDGTSFVDVTDPLNPTYLGNLPSSGRANIWRDVKVYADHAYIVADGVPNHGMQVFDLTQLRSVTTPPTTFTETAHYSDFSTAHNIVINEDTGFAYAVGVRAGGQTCGGGLHMIDINDPINPVFAGCFSADAYTHDAQCVVYHGPDTEHQGKEICFGANASLVSIADVTDKAAPVSLARASYPTYQYVHQGWLTEDHHYFIQNDELDEIRSQVANTRTLIWDVTDLDDPQLLTEHFSTSTAIDHNLYVRGDYVYQANYSSGLRILNISDIANPAEVAFFDTTPDASGPSSWEGTWSVYPFFKSGNLIVSSQGEGLFVLQAMGVATATETLEVPASFVFDAYPNPFNTHAAVSLVVHNTEQVTVSVYDMLGREVARLHDNLLVADETHRFSLSGADLPNGTYLVRARGETFSTTRLLTRVR